MKEACGRLVEVAKVIYFVKCTKPLKTKVGLTILENRLGKKSSQNNVSNKELKTFDQGLILMRFDAEEKKIEKNACQKHD